LRRKESSRWKRLVPLLQATSRRFSLPPPDSLALLAAGGLSGAGEPGESGIRWLVYISPPIRVLLVRLGLGFFASSSATRRRAHPGGLGFRRPILLFLQSISSDRGDGNVSSGDGAVRYVSSYLEKSGWSLPFGVVSSLLAWRSPARLEAPDLLSLGDGLLGRSSIQVCISSCNVPTVLLRKFLRRAGNRLQVAALALLSSWVRASSGGSGGRRRI